MPRKKKNPKTIETLTHDEASRKNIPTAEYQSVMREEEVSPIRIAYERRNHDLDPQLVWRGKDEQDWSDLVVQAPPLYIQEKIHPKVLIDDLLRRTENDKKAAEPQLDLFADFNGLADSRDGQLKEAEITHTAASEAPTRGDIRQGFVYRRVPHITLKSIANNAEIDVIWEKFQETLEPLREQLNRSLGTTWEEWEIPRDAEDDWPEDAKNLHAEWWKNRITRQKEIDASIAAHADFEYLYDKPYEDKKKVRVAGPFTVESLSPHRVLGVDENDELIDEMAESSDGYGEEHDFAQMILENLKTAGVQQAHKEDRINFTSITPWPGHYICAEGRYIEGDEESGMEKRAAIFIGPEFGTVSRPDLAAGPAPCESITGHRTRSGCRLTACWGRNSPTLTAIRKNEAVPYPYSMDLDQPSWS